jgi:glutaredoxin 3
MTDKKTIVWSRDMCPYCDRAKALLKSSGITFEERNLSTGDWTKEQLLEVVPDARTVPQIFMHGTYVGTYTDLQRYYEDHNMINGNEGF